MSILNKKCELSLKNAVTNGRAVSAQALVAFYQLRERAPIEQGSMFGSSPLRRCMRLGGGRGRVYSRAPGITASNAPKHDCAMTCVLKNAMARSTCQRP